MATNLKFDDKALDQVNLVPIEIKDCRSANEAYQQATQQLRRSRRLFPGAKNGLINAHKYLRKITVTESDKYDEDKEQQFLVTESWGESHLLALHFQAYTAGWFRAWVVLSDGADDILFEITDELLSYEHAPKGYVEFTLCETLLNNLNPLCDENCYVKVSLKLQGKIKLTSKINALVVNR